MKSLNVDRDRLSYHSSDVMHTLLFLRAIVCIYQSKQDDWIIITSTR